VLLSDDPSSLIWAVERSSKAVWTVTSIRFSIADVVSVCLLLANTRLLTLRFSCDLNDIGRTEREGGKKRRDFVQFGGLGGKVYQIAVQPRSSDYHYDQRVGLEHL
jgi:hypothetical protein